MSAAAALLRGRAKAEEKMVDECHIRRKAGTSTDRVSGKVSAAWIDVYDGKCKVQSKDSATARPNAGEHSYTVVSRQVHIPANAAEVKDGDVVTITFSLLNRFSVGKEYVVDGFTPDSYDTAARIPVKEMTS